LPDAFLCGVASKEYNMGVSQLTPQSTMVAGGDMP